jgi:hypothetical protein
LPRWLAVFLLALLLHIDCIDRYDGCLGVSFSSQVEKFLLLLLHYLLEINCPSAALDAEVRRDNFHELFVVITCGAGWGAIYE